MKWKRPVCLILLATLGSSACTTLRPVTSPQQFIPTAQPSRIWVTRTDNSKVMIEGPRLMGDTLVGFVAGRYEEILLPEARWMQVREPAPRRTAFLVGALALAGAGLIYLLASAGPSTSGPPNEDPSVPGGLLYFYPRGLR